jgi:uncharacterized protein (TIGR02246 family)
MDRRCALKLTGMALIGAAGLPSPAVATNKDQNAMSFSRKDIANLAAAYTAAWNTGSPQKVAGFFAEDGEIAINRGEPWRGRTGIAEMASGFFADVPDMKLVCDGVRCAGSHVVYLWTFTGHAAKTGKILTVHGWEEWDVGGDLKVRASRGWYDSEDYGRQVAGAIA